MSLKQERIKNLEVQIAQLQMMKNVALSMLNDVTVASEDTRDYVVKLVHHIARLQVDLRKEQQEQAA